jgi:hypothetical protein
MSSTDVPMEAMNENYSSAAHIKYYIMYFPPKTKLVRILEANLERKDLECLFKHNGWLDADVSKHVHIYLQVNCVFI